MRSLRVPAVGLALLWLLSACASMNPTPDRIEGMNGTRALYAKAETALSQGQKRDALFVYQDILKQQPDERRALIGSGNIYMDVGLPELAEDQFSQLLALNANDVEALEGRGLSYLKRHLYEASERDLLQAVDMDKKRWKAWNGLGIIADVDGQYDRSKSCYHQGLEVLPNYPPLLNNLGFSLIMDHRYKEAEQILRSGLRYAPDSKRLKNNLGIALAWQGQYQGSVDVISRVNGLAVAYNNVGYIALLKEDYKQAGRYFEQAMQSSPRYYPKAAQNLVRVHRLLMAQAGRANSAQ